MANLFLRSVKQLQEHLIQRGVVVTGLRKLELVELIKLASEINVPYDPDGLYEDRDEVIREKLQDGNIMLANPAVLPATEWSNDLAVLPAFHFMDIQSYMIQKQFSFGSVRDPRRSEGFTMMKDGFVKQVEVARLETGYFAVRSHVKPRTRDKDPITGAAHYYPWVILTSIDIDRRSCILSAFCTCKGGVDGSCRHVLATLHEVIDFRDDENKASATSGPCQWVRRATAQSAKLLTDINTAINLRPLQPIEEEYKPVPENVKPPVETILQSIRKDLPGSVFLHAWEDQTKDIPFVTPPLSITPPIESLTEFVKQHVCCSNCDCAEEFLNTIAWSSKEVEDTEKETQGQYKNKNWHDVRKGLITASRVRTVCHSTDQKKTAEKMIESQALQGENVPLAIRYGQDNEARALKMFVRTHRYRHRQCSFQQPGLVLCDTEPFLAASPDGIVTCKNPNCGKFLIEVKCLYKHRNFHPKVALKERDFCVKDSDDKYHLKKNHEYFYQVQCQMAVTKTSKCYLCIFTNKGIESIEVPFDPDFWRNTCEKLRVFWKHFIFPSVKNQVTNV